MTGLALILPERMDQWEIEHADSRSNTEQDQ